MRRGFALVRLSRDSVRVLRVGLLMARRKPDIDRHEQELRPALAVKLREVRGLHDRGYRPETLWLNRGDMCAIIADMGGAGFDVARGVVFRGIPVLPYAG